MKHRLTVTVDAQLASQARQAAHERGTSVSGWVEGVLRTALAQRPRRSQRFAERWLGRFSITPDRPNDPRLAALKAKYHLE